MTSKQQEADDGPHVGVLTGDGACQFPIVGESHYQNNIETIAGGKTQEGVHFQCITALIPEPANPYDPHAVRVDIQGRTVGYLGRDVAATFLMALSNGGFAAAVASAKIVGGWDRGGNDVGSFGVKLNAAMPFAFSTKTTAVETTSKVSQPLETPASPTPSVAALDLVTKKKKRRWPAVLGFAILVVILFNVFGSNQRAEKVVAVLNSQFGRICDAKIEGLFSDTLRVDWTASTTKLDFIAVMAAIGGAKSTIYDSGIRYLKFPNDAGGYNVIDWKTGEKTSVSERARYYFP